MKKRVPIITNNKQGWMWGYDGDGMDISSRMKNHRGTVQHQIAHTIQANDMGGVIEIARETEELAS